MEERHRHHHHHEAKHQHHHYNTLGSHKVTTTYHPPHTAVESTHPWTGEADADSPRQLHHRHHPKQ